MQCSPVVEMVLNHRQSLEKSRGSLFWCFCNGWGLTIVVTDILSRWPSPGCVLLLWYLEWALAFGLILNLCVHLYTYMYAGDMVNISPASCTSGVPQAVPVPITLSPKQRQLLGISPDDPAFPPTSARPMRSPPPNPLNISDLLLTPTTPGPSGPPSTSTTPINQSCSWLSDGSYLSSPNASLSSSSWMYYRPSPDDSARHRRSRTAPPVAFPARDETECLNRLLKEVDLLEKKLLQEESGRHAANASFNSYLGDRGRKQVYVLSVSSPGKPSSRTADAATRRPEDRNEMWTRLGVSPNILVQWTQNLRTWISQTILLRLLVEIESANSHLERLGFPDTQIGRCPLDKLKQVASSVQMLPTLPQLLPFLDVTPQHQEYLVGRIKELSGGGCMGAYAWNRGGNYRGKPWTHDLPADSTLVMHFLAAYLDACLPSPQCMGQQAKPFSSKYYKRHPWTPQREPTSPQGTPSPQEPSMVIYQAETDPPVFKLAVGGEVVDVPKGANNLFHAVLLFLHWVKAKEKGMLGRMNLGPSGINILGVMKDIS